MVTNGFVGLTPVGMQELAAAMDGARDDLAGRRRRIAGLLADAGVTDTVTRALATTEEWLESAAGDVRRRVELSQVTAVDPACQLPWFDILRRGWAALLHNGGNLLAGAAHSFADTGTTVWQLLPVHDEWRAAWVDLGAGVKDAATDPLAAGRAALGEQDLQQRGHSYWLGGFLPDLALTAAGGIGAPKLLLRAADTAGDVAGVGRVTSRLDAALQSAALRVRREATDGPDAEPQRGGHRPVPDPVVEPIAKAKVKEYDEASGGHSADRHGPETTLEQQKVRAETGLTPDGYQGKSIHSSRFLRWEDQRVAIERALAKRAARSAEEKAKDPFEYIPFDHVVGEGYMQGTIQYRETDIVRVRFDGDRFITSFPDLTRGVAV